MDAPIDVVQQFLIAFDGVLPGPWCATLAVSTLLVRASLTPLTLLQLRTSQRLSDTPAMQELRILNEQFAENRKRFPDAKSNAARTWASEVKKTFARHDVKLRYLFLAPATQVVTLLTFIWSIRAMVDNKVVDFSDGGILWFTDLGVQDPTFVLPVTSIFLTYCAMQMGFQDPISKTDALEARGKDAQDGKAKVQTISHGDLLIKIFQTILVFSTPLLSQLPAAVFCYWIPSATFSIVQGKVIRSFRASKRQERIAKVKALHTQRNKESSAPFAYPQAARRHQESKRRKGKGNT